jgi:hypothetical protein
MSSERPKVSRPFFSRFTDERAEDIHYTEILRKEVTVAWKASPWSAATALDHWTDTYLQYVEEIAARHDSPKTLPPAMRQYFRQAIYDVLSKETLIFGSLAATPIRNMPLKDQVELRQFLRARRHVLDNEERVSYLLFEAIASAFASIVVHYDPLRVAGNPDTSPYERVVAELELLLRGVTTPELAPPRTVEIPVCYGGELGPDLEDVPEKVREKMTFHLADTYADVLAAAFAS